MSLPNFGFSKRKSNNFESGNIDDGDGNVDAEIGPPEKLSLLRKEIVLYWTTLSLNNEGLLFIIIKFASMCLKNHESSIDPVYGIGTVSIIMMMTLMMMMILLMMMMMMMFNMDLHIGRPHYDYKCLQTGWVITESDVTVCQKCKVSIYPFYISFCVDLMEASQACLK